MIQALTEGFLLGISMGSYCAMSCAPFLFPYLLASQKRTMTAKLILFTQFLAGRLVAYLLFAVILAWMGITLQHVFTAKVQSVFLIIAACLMVIFSLSRSFPRFSFCSMITHKYSEGGFPFITGFILGLNLCPPFLVGITKALSFQNIFLSVLFFVFLFAGSTIYLLPFPVLSGFLRSALFERLGRYLGFLVGGWFLLQGLMGLL